jgi:hypothetical protein
MVLEKQNISLDFGKGLNEVVDSDLVDDGTLLKVVDGVYNKGGRVDKRSGYESLTTAILNPTGTPPTTILQGVTGVHNHNGKLIAAESSRVLPYNESKEVWTTSKGYYRACALSKEDIAGNQGNIIRTSQAELNNIKVVVFETEDHITGYKIIDKTSKTTLFLTFDINLQLYGGSYNDEDKGGADDASQYTEPTVISTGNRIWIFVVKDRYNFPISGGAVPVATLPSGDGIYNTTGPTIAPQYSGCKEAPKLMMFGLNLDTYQLNYGNNVFGKYHYYFNLQHFNNWNVSGAVIDQPSVPVPLYSFFGPPGVQQCSDHRFLSYDVCQMQEAFTGLVDTSKNYFTVLESSYETCMLYLMNATTGLVVDSAVVGRNSNVAVAASPGFTPYNSATTEGTVSLFPFNHVALGQASGGATDSVRTWVWRYNQSGLAPIAQNMCFMRAYDVDPNLLTLTVVPNNTGGGATFPAALLPGISVSGGLPEIGLYIDTFDDASRPWSSFNPLTGKNIISVQAESASLVFNTTQDLTRTAVEPFGSAGWDTSEIQIPPMATAITEPFLYLENPSGLTDYTRQRMAIAVTPVPAVVESFGQPGRDILRTNFIMAQGSQKNIIAKYSQGVATKEIWGKPFVFTANPASIFPAGIFPYNSDWDHSFTTPGAPYPPPPLILSEVLSNIGQFTSPRPIAIRSDSGYYSPTTVFDKFTLPSLEAIQAEVEDGLIEGDGRVRELTFNLAPGISPDFIDFSNELYLNGGYLGIFDNNVIAENNFHLPPDFFISTGTVIPVPPSPTSPYWGYCCTYEWMDDNGNLHRSSPSRIVYTSTDASAAPLELTITQPIFTSKDIREVHIAVFRTTQDGQVFYRVTKLTPNTQPDSPGDPNVLSDINASIRCAIRGGPIVFRDALDDDSIIGNETLYTTGSILPNIAPPSFNVMVEFGGRIFGAGLDNPNRIYFSKIKDPNTSVEFSDALYIEVPPEGGNITGLAVLDSNLIIFKDRKVFRVYGEGPNDTGVGGNYSTPLLISSSHGAKTKKAILNTVEGVIFRGGDGGIYLLDRSLNFSYIGGPVEDSNDLEIVHSTNVGSESEIRFVLENGEALVYNYWFKVWTRFTNHTSVDSTYWNDKFVMARVTDAKGVWVQTPNSYLDITDPILLDVETSWIKLAGIKGYQRCNWFSVLGAQTAAHDVEVTLYRDYNNAPVEQILVDGADIFDIKVYGDSTCGDYGDEICGTYGWPGDDVYQWRHKPKIQKCESIKLKFKDKASLSGVYDPLVATSFSLKNLTLHVGIKKGQFKLPERKTV